MKNLMLTTGILLSGIICVQAQQKPGMGAKQTTTTTTTTTSTKSDFSGKMATACKLTPEQQTKVKPMTAAFMKGREEAKKQNAGNKDAMKTAMKANRAK